MANVIPNSTVQLFQGVPLNRDSEDLILFTTESLQNLYFRDALRATFTADNFVFVKKENQAIRVQAAYGKVYQCNYLRFNNSQKPAKWFYAFVTDVIYINEFVTEIEYEIDRMQTWLPGIDYELTECYVEREHTTTDVIGENLLPENVELGDPKLKYIDELKFNGEWLAVLLSGEDRTLDFKTLQFVGGKTFNLTYDRIPCGYIILLFNGPEDQTDDEDNRGNYSELVKLFDSVEYQKNIVGCYSIPTDFTMDSDCVQQINLGDDIKCYCLLKDETEIPLNRREGTKVQPREIELSEDSSSGGWLTDIDGYVPKNNKLFTFPYNAISVLDNHGNENVFKIEYFDDKENISFTRFGSFTPPVSSSILPNNYNVENGIDQNPQFRMNNSPSSIGGYTGDMFLSNLRQQLPSIIATVGTMVAAPAVGVAQGAVTLATSLTGHHSVTQSTTNPNNIDTANYFMFYTFARRMIRRSYAERIDNYFNAYGYRVDEIKKPNVDARKLWTYVKTEGANFLSKNVPADDMKIINDKFNSGVRFHKTYSSIGNLTQENAVKEE